MKTLLLLSLAGAAVSGAIRNREPPAPPSDVASFATRSPDDVELDRKRKRDGGEESEEDVRRLPPPQLNY